ncbi:MAG: carbamate kinase [Desulfurococcales archaeon]|nr:carbamate kinase [Desulfurococcales archaeon]
MPRRMLVVVALGGNALLRKGQKGEIEEQWATARAAARSLAVALSDVDAVVTHGNGPQVGYLLEAFNSLPPDRPRQPLYLAVAMTQGWIGFILQHSLEEAMPGRRVIVVPTRVVVRRDDPALKVPTKPVGPFYTREEAEELEKRLGWVMREDPRGGYRRLVPSPRPVKVLEAGYIKELARRGALVIAAGGGGIPILETGEPVDAVVDKDLASSLLARSIGADRLVILTDVPGVAVGYGRPGARWLSRVTVSELKHLHRMGHFPPGSMGPKVEAAIEFVEATGGTAHIGSLDRALEVIAGTSGTIVVPG